MNVLGAETDLSIMTVTRNGETTDRDLPALPH